MYAHREGVVYSDIKPANVLFGERAGTAAGFGIAHVSAETMTWQMFTTAGTAMVSGQYVAPEQLEGVRDDPQVDV